MKDFPDTPNVGDQFEDGYDVYEWDGVAWVYVGSNQQVPPASPFPPSTPPTGWLPDGVDFPDNPQLGDTFSDGIYTWEWDGASWVYTFSRQVDWDNVTGKPDFDSLYVRRDGSTMTGYLTLIGMPTDPDHAANKQYIDNIKGVIDGQILTIDNAITSLQFDIVANTSAISGLDTRVGANETSILNNASNIANNSQAIAANTSAISGLDTRVGANETDILNNASGIANNSQAIVDLATLVDSTFLKLTGGTLTGSLTLDDADLYLKGNDTVGHAIVYLDDNGDPVGGFAFSDTEQELVFTGIDSEASYDQSLMTRLRSDNRYTRYSGDWSAGTFQPNQVVTHNGSTWLALNQTTEEPTPAATDWISLGGGASVSIGDTPPTTPADGDLWLNTGAPYGLYAWFDDGDSQQWVQTNGGGDADTAFLPLSGGTLTGLLEFQGGSGVPVIRFNRTDNAVDQKKTLLAKNSDGRFAIFEESDAGVLTQLATFRSDGNQSNVKLTVAENLTVRRESGGWASLYAEGPYASLDYYAALQLQDAATGNRNLVIGARGAGGSNAGRVFFNLYNPANDAFVASPLYFTEVGTSVMRVGALLDAGGTTRFEANNGNPTDIRRNGGNLGLRFETSNDITFRKSNGSDWSLAWINASNMWNFSGTDIRNVRLIEFSGTSLNDYIRWITGQGMYGYENGNEVWRLGVGAFTTRFQNAYDRTTSSAASLFVGSDGSLLRSTSHSKYKTASGRELNGLDFINALTPRFFKSLHKDDDPDEEHLGFYADEVAAVMPAASQDGGENYDPRAIIAGLVKAVQELATQLGELRNA